MIKEFVSYELALEIKQLGFDEPCFAVYENKKWFLVEVKNEMSYESCLKLDVFPAPTFSQCFRWFREKYNILATVYSNASGYLYEWSDNVGGTNRGWSDYEGPNDSGVWDTYEEAELACLEKLIEIVKEKK